jgi:hypothetical protein
MRADEPTSDRRRTGRLPVESDDGLAPAGKGVSPPADATNPGPTAVFGSSELFAAQLRDAAAAVFMSSSMSPALQVVPVDAFKIYRDRLIADCGAPEDPIEVMLVEQLALAHLNTGLLHSRAANATSIECATAYCSAAARLLGEFRRTALALAAYKATARQMAQQVGPTVTVDVAGMIREGPGKEHDDIEEGLTPGDDDGESPRILRFPRTASL